MNNKRKDSVNDDNNKEINNKRNLSFNDDNNKEMKKKKTLSLNDDNNKIVVPIISRNIPNLNATPDQILKFMIYEQQKQIVSLQSELDELISIIHKSNLFFCQQCMKYSYFEETCHDCDQTICFDCLENNHISSCPINN